MRIRRLLSSGVICYATCAFSADFTVVNLSDDMLPGSLRSALLQAQGTPESDLISFDASLAGGVIHLSAGLDVTGGITIVGDVNEDGSPDITIDRTGYTGDEPCVTLSGSDNLLRGLTIRGCAAGIFTGAPRQRILGCVLQQNETGVYCGPSHEGGATSDEAQIGGLAAGEGNEILDNTLAGIVMDGQAGPATGALIAGNRIERNGRYDPGNGPGGGDVGGGIVLRPGFDQIQVEGNVIAGNGGFGLVAAGTEGLVVTRNYVGVRPGAVMDPAANDYTLPRSVKHFGIGIVSGARAVIGPGNYIGYDDQPIVVVEATSIATITQNRYYHPNRTQCVVNVICGNRRQPPPPTINRSRSHRISGNGGARKGVVEVYSGRLPAGQQFLGTARVRKNGNWSLRGNFKGRGRILSATTTSRNGRTSPFDRKCMMGPCTADTE